MDDLNTYEKPEHGWTCFFCGERFTTFGGARDHFGAEPIATPGCQIKVGEERGLLMTLRRAEDQLARYYAEDSDTQRAMRAMAAKHTQELLRAEEVGYARGLRDSSSEAQAKRIAELEAERDALKVDAGRYRYLRDSVKADVKLYGNYREWDEYSHEALDEKIDAAIKEQAK